MADEEAPLARRFDRLSGLAAASLRDLLDVELLPGDRSRIRRRIWEVRETLDRVEEQLRNTNRGRES